MTNTIHRSSARVEAKASRFQGAYLEQAKTEQR